MKDPEPSFPSLADIQSLFSDRLGAESLVIAIDMQCTQSNASRNRGVGRYVTTLVLQLAKTNAYDSINLFFSRDYEIPVQFLVGTFRINYYTDIDQSSSIQARSLARSHDLELVNPDVILAGHLFEGYNEESIIPPLPIIGSSVIYCTIVYDLIPLVLSDHYFKFKDFKDWWLEKSEYFKYYDHVFGISESSCLDLIAFLNHDSAKTSFLGGAVNQEFVSTELRNPDCPSLANLSNRDFIAFVGGYEYRKNLNTVISAFKRYLHESALDSSLSLVIACNIPESVANTYCSEFKESGYDEDLLVFTGFISEHDLKWLINKSKFLLFPSYYEGLGLPILEGMIMNTPTITSNTSSMKELISHDYYLVDPYDVNSISKAISRLQKDPRLDLFSAICAHTLERFNADSLVRFFNAKIVELLENRRSEVPSKAKALKIAFFSPVLPSESGIATYANLTLEHLKTKAIIDVFPYPEAQVLLQHIEGVRLMDHKSFKHCANSYDICLFHMGNSHFHAYMFEHIDFCRENNIRVAVFLHDAFLSGLYGFMYSSGLACSQLKGDSLANEAIHQYGINNPKSIFGNTSPAFSDLIRLLPFSQYIATSCDLLLSHSRFNLDIYRFFNPALPITKYNIVKQMCNIRPLEPSSTQATRAELGLSADSLVIITAGFVDQTKCSDLAFDAVIEFCRLEPAASVVFVFLGLYQANDTLFSNCIENLKCKAETTPNLKVVFTGFIDDILYNKYLDVSDVGIQLRQNTRGGTPKGVLDFLSRLKPVIVNRYGSYTDYPEDVVLFTSSTPTCAEICSIITRLYKTDSLLVLRNRINHYMLQNHNPHRISDEYISILSQIVNHSRFRAPQPVIESLVQFDKSPEAKSIVSFTSLVKPFFSSSIANAGRKRRIYIDFSLTNAFPKNTGIQRVARQVISEISKLVSFEFEFSFVALEHDSKICTYEFNDGCFTLAADEFDPQPFDIFLLIDTGWILYKNNRSIIDSLRMRKVIIASLYHDIIPITHPQFFPEKSTSSTEAWNHYAVSHTDLFLYNSDFTKRCYIRHFPELSKRQVSHRTIRLGSDSVNKFNQPFSQETTLKYSVPDQFILIVGSIEPRKNQLEAIKAFVDLDQAGLTTDFSLIVVGNFYDSDYKLTWERQFARLRSNRIVHLEKASDELLSLLYGRAMVLLHTSHVEGYGLPIVEALSSGTHVICSDIPAFREVAGDSAYYIDQTNSSTISMGLRKWFKLHSSNELPPINYSPPSWRDTVSDIINALKG